jgi:hypothetical protein
MAWYCLDGDFFEHVDKLTAQVATVDATTDHHDDDDDASNNVVHARHVTTSPRRSSTATSPSSSYLRRRVSSSSSSSTTPPTTSQHSHYRRRGSSHQPLSPGSPPLSLEEYQREQEMEVPDTVASKALYFLHHVDPHKFTNAVIGINAGMNDSDYDDHHGDGDSGAVVDDGWMNGCIFMHYMDLL